MTDDDSAAGVFDERTRAWRTWQSQPWGRLRYAVAAATTARALAHLPGPLRVVDVGGGDGSDSLPLARAGHHVTVLDFSRPLLDAAEDAARTAGLTDRVRTVHADLDDLPALRLDRWADGVDAVLCHNVVHYRADLPGTVSALVDLVRPGGVVSVMAPNPAMDVLATAIRHADPAAALAVLDEPTVHGDVFDHRMRRVEAATAEAALTAVGCTVQHRFGITCVMGLIADDEIKHDPGFYAQVEALELALCEREPYWRTGRFWQLTARRDRVGAA